MALEFPFEPSKLFLEPFVAVAEDDELSLRRDNFRQRAQHEVDTFLFGQTRDHADDRAVLFRQLECLAEGIAVFSAVLDRAHVELARNPRVSSWVEQL